MHKETVTRMMIDCIVLELKAPGMTSGEFINDIFNADRYVWMNSWAGEALLLILG